VEILFLLVGLVFVAFGVAVVLSEASARHGAWVQQGEVIGFSSGKGGGSGAPSYHPSSSTSDRTGANATSRVWSALPRLSARSGCSHRPWSSRRIRRRPSSSLP